MDAVQDNIRRIFRLRSGSQEQRRPGQDANALFNTSDEQPEKSIGCPISRRLLRRLVRQTILGMRSMVLVVDPVHLHHFYSVLLVVSKPL